MSALARFEEEWGWIDGEQEPAYSPEEIMRVADWLVQKGYAKPGYAEALRRGMEASKGGAPCG